MGRGNKTVLDLVERFWANVDKDPGQGPNGDCWFWLGTFDKRNGRGYLWDGKTKQSVSRVAAAIQHENFQCDLEVHSVCREVSCARGSHLFQKSREDLFWDSVDKDSGLGPWGDCWIWTGCLNKNGYEQTLVKGKYAASHRFAYELQHGVFDKSLLVCHRCDVKLCVRKDHLFLGTQKDNVDDMVSKGRARSGGHLGRKKCPEGMAFCSTCSRILPHAAFHSHKGRWNKLSNECKNCQKARRLRNRQGFPTIINSVT